MLVAPYESFLRFRLLPLPSSNNGSRQFWIQRQTSKTLKGLETLPSITFVGTVGNEDSTSLSWKVTMSKEGICNLMKALPSRKNSQISPCTSWFLAYNCASSATNCEVDSPKEVKVFFFNEISDSFFIWYMPQRLKDIPLYSQYSLVQS